MMLKCPFIEKLAVSNHTLFIEERLKNPLSVAKTLEEAEEFKEIADMYSLHIKKAFSRMSRYT